MTNRGAEEVYLYEKDILKMQLDEAKGVYDEQDDTTAKLAFFQSMLGEKITVPYGTLTGQQAEIVKVTEGKVKLRVQLLGRDSYLKLPISAVFEAIHDSP